MRSIPDSIPMAAGVSGEQQRPCPLAAKSAVSSLAGVQQLTLAQKDVAGVHKDDFPVHDDLLVLA